MRKVLYKISILVLAVFIVSLGLTSKAATGYSYDHNKKIIYSAEGLIYDHSFDGKTLGIGYNNLTSPEDFFIFKHPNDESKNCMYLTDSKANAVYVLDMNFEYHGEKYTSFKLDPTQFTDQQLSAIKSGGQQIVGSAGSAEEVSKEFIQDINTSLSNNDFVPEGGFVIDENTTVEQVSLENLYQALKYCLVGNLNDEGEWDSSEKGLFEVDEELITKWSWFISYAQSANLDNERVKGACAKVNVDYDYSGTEDAVYDEYSALLFVNNIHNLLNNTKESFVDESDIEGIGDYSTCDWSNTDALDQLLQANIQQNLAAIRAGGLIDINLKNPTSTYRSVITKFADESLDNRDFIYVCDYGNNQVLCIDAQTKEVKIVITNPNEYETVLVFDALSFQPQRVVTDNAGRIYVIANSVYEGILQFDADGVYKRFTGVNNVTLKAWDIFWLSISTESQYESRKSYINTTFTSMAVDQSGTFIYCTAAPIKNSDGSVTATAMIKKLNPAGKDVLRRNGYAPPQGDLTYVVDSANLNEIATGPSVFVGITVNEYGMYTVIDNNRRRLFTYDNEGNLLYISGEKGRYTDALDNPVAIQYYDGDIVVLDKNTKELKVFVSTEIGTYINKAVQAEYEGDIDTAAEYWKKVIKFNANYEYAYVGVGKKYLKDKEYKLAMSYFKSGSNKLQYSESYKLYRNDLIKRYAPPVLYVVVGLVLVLVIIKLIRKKLGKGKPKEELNMGEDE